MVPKPHDIDFLSLVVSAHQLRVLESVISKNLALKLFFFKFYFSLTSQFFINYGIKNMHTIVNRILQEHCKK